MNSNPSSCTRISALEPGSQAIAFNDQAGRLAKQILSAVGSERPVIQDFCPLADSIEWQLGQQYWHERGSKAFLSDAKPVPYLINNDGNLSLNAAEVLFASLLAAEQAGNLSPQIFCLELGIGVGLFARLFLDAFQHLCQGRNKDYYDRLTYIAGDRSEPMLLDACRHGVFARHPGRYLLRPVDAVRPVEYLQNDLAFAEQGPQPLHAVFLNYVLDCLPAGVLEVEDDQVRELCVRTCLARGVKLEEHTDLTAEQLAGIAGSANSKDRRELLGVYGLFASEYDYRPVDIARIPYGDFAVQFSSTHSKRLLHNYGAIQSLEGLLKLLRPDGFILINDYGPTEIRPAEEYEHQRFSNATSIGLNFPLLKAYFSDAGKCRWIEPDGENEHIHSRLLGHEPAAAAVGSFQERFSKAAFERTREPAQRARELAKIGKFETAANSYRKALEHEPYNWALMSEIAFFLIYSLRNPKAGIDLAKVGLNLNPSSAELWNALGDGLYEFGRVDESKSAYLRAQELNTHDARARYSLAWVYAHQKDYATALQKIAEALVLDKTGAFRERLLQKQGEILNRMSQQAQQEYLLMSNRVSTTSARANEAPLDAGENSKPPPTADASPQVKGAEEAGNPITPATHLGSS